MEWRPTWHGRLQGRVKGARLCQAAGARIRHEDSPDVLLLLPANLWRRTTPPPSMWVPLCLRHWCDHWMNGIMTRTSLGRKEVKDIVMAKAWPLSSQIKVKTWVSLKKKVIDMDALKIQLRNESWRRFLQQQSRKVVDCVCYALMNHDTCYVMTSSSIVSQCIVFLLINFLISVRRLKQSWCEHWMPSTRRENYAL